MNITITIQNNHGELFDRVYSFDSLDEMRNIDMNKIFNEAEENRNNEGLLGTFESKEAYEEKIRGDDESFMNEVTAGEIY